MQRFYFDHNATTPVSREVLEAMLPVLSDDFGNASSIHHFGQAAKQHLETARRRVAAFLGCTERDVAFTSGGTEADNLAVFGTTIDGHIVTSAIEHPAVLNSCAELERRGVAVTYVRPSSSGVVDPGDIRRALRADTRLVSVMHANNELGAVQPVAEIARIAHEAGALMHSDGVQAAGKIRVNVAELGVDLYSISGHKLYAPKGVGALCVRKDTPLARMFFGGHHERDRRPGTENVPGAVALGRAAEWFSEKLDAESKRVGELRDRLESAILDRVQNVRVNAGGAPRTPNTSNLCFAGIEGEAMVIGLDLKGFAVSSGAACSSGAVEPSHVLKAIGLTNEQARASIRFSLGRSNTTEQVDALIEAVVAVVARLRKLSPSYTNA